MICELNLKDYELLLERLTEAVGGRHYFNGTVRAQGTGVDFQLTCSCVVYRSAVEMPDGRRDEVTDLVPVWWELRSVGDDGEVDNDFSFDTMRELLRGNSIEKRLADE